MNMTILIGLFVFIIIFLFVRMPKFLLRFVRTGTVRLAIGLLMLVLLNVFGNSFGLHVPINLFTVLVSSVLGIFGVASLALIHLLILA
ncbi:MAG: pro-sigmaK processing inhibitor BofA [Bacilli bacterium]|nr:pro-sigmaK processing inhibitor BofA [Bacilli bacterium]